MYDTDVNDVQPALSIHIKTLQELYGKPFVRATYLYAPNVERKSDLEVIRQKFYGIRVLIHECDRMTAEVQFHKSGGITHYAFHINQKFARSYGNPTQRITTLSTTSKPVVFGVLKELESFLNILHVLPNHAKFVLMLDDSDYSAALDYASCRLDQGELDFLTKYNPYRKATVGIWSKLDLKRESWVAGLTEAEAESVGSTDETWYRYLTSLHVDDTESTREAKRLSALKMEAKPCMPNLA